MRRDEMTEEAFKVEEVEQKRRWKRMVGVFLLLFFSYGEESLPEVPSCYCDGQFRKPKSQRVE